MDSEVRSKCKNLIKGIIIDLMAEHHCKFSDFFC